MGITPHERSDDALLLAARDEPDEELERIEADALREGPHARVLEELAALPADQRAAVEAQVLHELDYAQIAFAAGASEVVVRKRVSRGLSRLRERLERTQP
jgi:DNA-directed RNA polymerase specialized sigma24 family protein